MFFSATFFILGAIMASFAGVVAGRLNTGEGFVRGRSRCDACGAVLKPLMLVPILSHLASRGRAACCGARLPVAAPISEALLGTLFVLAYQALGFSLALLFFLIALTALAMLVIYDLAHQILPPVLLAVFTFASALAGAAAAPSASAFFHTAIIALLIGGSLLAINLISRGRAMGFSDAPLAFALALLTGGAAFPGLVFSFWIGAGIGIGILARRPKGSRIGVEVPFAPFLAAGFLLAYFTQWNPFLFNAVLP